MVDSLLTAYLNTVDFGVEVFGCDREEMVHSMWQTVADDMVKAGGSIPEHAPDPRDLWLPLVTIRSLHLRRHLGILS
jgi:hypothetical protein